MCMCMYGHGFGPTKSSQLLPDSSYHNKKFVKVKVTFFSANACCVQHNKLLLRIDMKRIRTGNMLTMSVVGCVVE